MTDDDSEHLDEFGDVPAIDLADDPLAIIPPDELQLIGEIMAWAAYIEADLFLLFVVAHPGEAQRRRKQFYRETTGLYKRAQLVRQAFEGRAELEVVKALDRLMEQVNILGSFRNDIAHNPIIRFGPKRALVRWMLGKGEGAGKLERMDAARIRPVFPEIRRLHDELRGIAGRIHSPSGGSFAIAFGETDARMEAQIARYIAEANRTAE